MSTAQRSGVVALASVQIGLLIAALADLRRRSAREVRGDKRIWAMVCFVNFVGPLAYFRFGRRR